MAVISVTKQQQRGILLLLISVIMGVEDSKYNYMIAV